MRDWLAAPPVVAFDAAAERAFDRVRGRRLADRYFYTASRAGDWSRLWHDIALAIAIVRPDRRRAMVRLAAALGVESLLVNQGLKRVFRRVRPVFEGERPHRLRRPSTTSFPSGHASSAVVAASLLSDALPRGRFLWWPLAASVAASRVYVRVHHASDVVAGAALGFALAGAVRRLWPLGNAPARWGR